MELTMLNIDALLLRIGIQCIVVLAIVFLLYYRGNGNKDFCFSYVAIGLIVFALCTLLEQVELELGFALGLFAIFGIIRYRTITIPIKEMTYLFVVIGISVVNALAGSTISIILLSIANFMVLICLCGLEIFMLRNRVRSMLIRYEKVENLHANRKQELISDLKERLGIMVTHYELEEVDFLRDTANLLVFYKGSRSSWEVSHVPTNDSAVVFDR